MRISVIETFLVYENTQSYEGAHAHTCIMLFDKTFIASFSIYSWCISLIQKSRNVDMDRKKCDKKKSSIVVQSV